MAVEIGRIKAVFHAALAKPTDAARAAYLAETCRGEPEVRKRVEALLAAHQRSGEFLDLPTSDGTTAPVTPMESVGVEIGPYKLLEQIGEGGFGVVFLAEQRQPIRRRVALKILKPGMDSKQVIARFQAEQQAMALMDHPNIAKVFDAGVTATGRPYFVMELVKGIAITEYCNQCSLTMDARLRLFMTVCQAIQHAHQKGVIHRDIKPSNVLVAMHDGAPAAKVIDFGIAKAINQRLTDDSLHTGFAQMVGTPMYMSPEQAEMSAMEIDTRGDIYSLGVLLYELLTGQTPFTRDRLRNASFDELRRIIREEDPPLPSSRLSTLDAEAATTVATQRRTEPQKLVQSVRGDLDWIVMKCLEKDRTRRYETANGLNLDLQRYLDNEPVSASPITWTYRLRKFVRRNWVPVAIAAAFAATVLAGAAFSTAMYFKERAAKDLAERKESEASAALERSENALALIQRLLAGVEPGAFYDPTLLEEVLAQSDENLAAVESLNTLGLVMGDRGRFVEAEQILSRAAEMVRRITDCPRPVQVKVISNLGLANGDTGDLVAAENAFQEALRLVESDPNPDEMSIAGISENLAYLQISQGRFDKAAELLQQTLRTRLTELGLQDARTLESQFYQGEIAQRQKEYAKAKQLQEKVVQTLRQTDTGEDWGLQAAQLEFAVTLMNVGELGRAEEEALQAVQNFEATRPDSWQLDNARSVLGEVYLRQQRLNEASEFLTLAHDGLHAKRPLIRFLSLTYYRDSIERMKQLNKTLGRDAEVKKWENELRDFDADIHRRAPSIFEPDDM